MNSFTLINSKSDFKTAGLEIGSCFFRTTEKKSNISIFVDRGRKFLEDQVLFEDSEIVFVLLGVVLNKNDFCFDHLSWKEFCVKGVKTDYKSFVRSLRGSFNGLIYFKTDCEIISFSDHISTKPVFYYEYKTDLIISSQIGNIHDIILLNDLDYSLSKNGKYMLLSYGFLHNDETLINQIRKVPYGNIALFSEQRKSFFRFYQLDNTPNYSISYSDIIENLDLLFKQAIKRQFDKDIEYGYMHFVALSGGLDSRMTSWVSNEMGYTNQLNYTFAESDCLDQKIAQKLANYLEHEWIFKSLDGGLFLKKVDDVLNLTGGNVSYHGIAHALSMYEYINFDNLGICHSGQLGDVIVGSYSKNIDYSADFDSFSGAFSNYFLNNVSLNHDIEYENQEIYKLSERGFNGINMGLSGIQKFTETISPFYDVDFMDYVLKIPLKYRIDHKIYFDWINKMYPQAGDFIWEKTETKVNRNRVIIRLKKREFDLLLVVKKLKKIFLKKVFKINGNKGMNPLNDYLGQDEIKFFYASIIEICKNSLIMPKEDIDEILKAYYENDNGLFKTQIITYLTFLKKMKQL